jgi:hypothetical protein
MSEQNTQERARRNGHSNLIADTYGPELEALTLEELQQELVDLGQDYYAPARQARIADIRGQAQARAIEANRGKVEKFFLGFRRVVQVIGHVILMAVTLVISYVFLPVAVMGLGLAEYQRVKAGIGAFDPERAGLMSAVAVTTYMLLLFIQAQKLHDEPTRQRAAFSLRLWAASAAYWLGIGRQWQARHKGQYEMLRGAIGFLAVMIVLLGTAGALQAEIVELSTPGQSWHGALYRLAVESDLRTFINWIGGGALTIALLSSLHFVIALTYDRYVQLVPDGGTDFLSVSSGDYSAEMDRAEALYLAALIKRAKERQNRNG